MDSKKFVIFCQATGPYLEFFAELFRSIVRVAGNSEGRLRFVLFTDGVLKHFLGSDEQEGWDVKTITVKHENWPQSSIGRYLNYQQAVGLVSSDDVILALDADIVARRSFVHYFDAALRKSDYCFVQHPGFYRPTNPVTATRFYSRTGLSQLRRDVNALINVGGIGDWEVDERSAAYVPRKNRKHYVCGGVWACKGHVLSDFLNRMVTAIQRDESAPVRARWHDESLLNASVISPKIKKTATILGAEFCFAPGYDNLSALTPVLEAVDKGPDWER